MTKVREPVLLPVALAEMRPTQITVGMREVLIKRKAWEERSAKKDRKFLGRHMMPTVIGPKERHYIIDHHHLGLALVEEGEKEIFVRAIADLSRLDESAFWAVMDARAWVHPYDDKGRRRDYKDIPKTLKAMVDDPFRSLAGELRRVGGFAKETIPFAEFLWADYLRRRMKRALVEKDFSRAVEKALALSKLPDADYLPGWCGADPEA
jgi:hypothetical protein